MESIEQQLNQVDWKNLESISRFYESNQLYFDNYALIEDENKISDLIDIKLHYANALYNKSHYDKLLMVLDHVQDLLAKLSKDHWNYLKSERYVRFMRGKVFGNRKNFKESFRIFKELVKEDPDQHYYLVWYHHARLGFYNWIFNAASIIGLILVFFDFIFRFDKFLSIDIGTLGAVIAILSYLVQKALAEYYRRKKTAHNK